MQKGTWSVLLACFLGAFIGALCAHEISVRFAYGQYFWGIGALFGGCVAYLAVDFRQFCNGFARSFCESKSNIATMWERTINWKPNKIYWSTVGAMFAGTSALVASAELLFGIVVFIVTARDQAIEPIGFLTFMFKVLSILMIFISAIGAVSACSRKKNISDRSYKRDLLYTKRNGWEAFRTMNPISLTLLVAKWLLLDIMLVGFWYLLRNTPRFVRATLVFTRLLCLEFKQFVFKGFVYVHSERRTLCFLDATLGATAGFFIGSAIAGAVIGAILGVINYEIVSIRWLKLVPAKAKK